MASPTWANFGRQWRTEKQAMESPGAVVTEGPQPRPSVAPSLQSGREEAPSCLGRSSPLLLGTPALLPGLCFFSWTLNLLPVVLPSQHIKHLSLFCMKIIAKKKKKGNNKMSSSALYLPGYDPPASTVKRPKRRSVFSIPSLPYLRLTPQPTGFCLLFYQPLFLYCRFFLSLQEEITPNDLINSFLSPLLFRCSSFIPFM